MTFALTTIFELALVIAVFWGIFHEDSLIAFEKRIGSSFRRRRLKLVKKTVRSRNLAIRN